MFYNLVNFVVFKLVATIILWVEKVRLNARKSFHLVLRQLASCVWTHRSVISAVNLAPDYVNRKEGHILNEH